MYYKYQYPTISFILTNADRPEHYREKTRHAPTFFPAPHVLWVPEIPGRPSTVIIEPLRPPQLDFPPDWIHTYRRHLLKAKRDRAKAAASAPSPPGLESLPEEHPDDGSDDDSVVSVTPGTGNRVKVFE